MAQNKQDTQKWEAGADKKAGQNQNQKQQQSQQPAQKSPQDGRSGQTDTQKKR